MTLLDALNRDASFAVTSNAFQPTCMSDSFIRKERYAMRVRRYKEVHVHVTWIEGVGEGHGEQTFNSAK